MFFGKAKFEAPRPADTARPGGAAYAPHDEGAEKLAESTSNKATAC
jgi:hypothetical protein